MGAILPFTDPSLPTEVSPLFSDTTAARGEHMRTNNNRIWANLVFLLPAIDTFNYDHVVDSDVSFLAWQSGTYAHVLIKSGTWTLASGGINLTARGTKTITGESGSKLIFTDVNTTAYGLYYTTAPTTNDYWMRGVSIDVTRASNYIVSGFRNCINLTECTSVVQVSSGDNVTMLIASGFELCTNLINCIGTCTGIVFVYGVGFNSCTNLTNCTGIGTSGEAYSEGFGFYYCINLNNCIGTGTGGTESGDNGTGFHHCNNLHNCTGTGTGNYGYGFSTCTSLNNCNGTGTGLSASGYGFYTCVSLNNCTTTITGRYAYGFYACTSLNNCAATITGSGTIPNSSGFHSCIKLTNCIGICTSYYAYGFHTCTSLTNCSGTGQGAATSGGVYGFYSCTQIIGCIGVGTATGSGVGYGFYDCKKCCENKALTSTTAKYLTSYADAGTSAACADTAAGGWNS